LLAALPSGSVWEQQADVQGALRSMLDQDPQPANFGQVLDAASSFSNLMHEPALQQRYWMASIPQCPTHSAPPCGFRWNTF
jgi:anaerobic glycerol-3-phosphate dehydrogenase